MRTYTQIIYQIVFATHQRKPILIKEARPSLFSYINGILQNKKCHLYRINGIEDHLHIVTHIHPMVSLASLMKDIKVGSSRFIKEQGLFPDFTNWQDGYGAFTYSIKEKDRLIDYVINQEDHHQKVNYMDELKGLLLEHGIEYDESYLED